jgi:hypothetical protein
VSRSPIDPDVLRTLVRRARNPRGIARDERLPQRYLFNATVTAVGSGVVTIDRHGVSIPNVAHLAAYSPSVSDLVRCEFVGDDVMCWGAW